MTKFKTLFALCIVVAIVSTCVLSASASITSTTSVIWNANETAASAQTIGNGPLGTNFWVDAYIYSTSTRRDAYTVTNSSGASSTISATAGPVPVTYPSDIPLVEYSGSHGIGIRS